MLRFSFLFCLAVAFACCQNNSTAEQPASEPAATEQPAAQPATGPTLPSLPLETVQRLFNEASQVDYIFYHYPFTMSMDEKPAIQYTLRQISEQPAPLNPNCKAAGRVTYQIDGNIVLEGDFYFSTGCTYFVFYENKEKKYANYMTDEGITYFNNQIQQNMQLQKQAQGQ